MTKRPYNLTKKRFVCHIRGYRRATIEHRRRDGAAVEYVRRLPPTSTSREPRIHVVHTTGSDGITKEVQVQDALHRHVATVRK